MAHKHEAEKLLGILKTQYSRLFELGARQLDLIQNHATDDSFMSIYQQIMDEWVEIQRNIENTNELLHSLGPLDNYKELYPEDIAGLTEIVSNILSTTKQASTILQDTLRTTGSMIRSASEHKQASRAYYFSGFDDRSPVFFDEKK